MPFTKKDLEDLPISFSKKGDVWAIVGPCSASYWREPKIPLDGRKYKCAGTVIFKNGNELRASFTVDTTTFDFLDLGSVYVNIGDDWYNIDESELLTKLKLSAKEIFPFTWLPDRPLDYHFQGPYKMKMF